MRALLQVIADFTNFNVVTSDTVTGNVTLRLKDVPWDQALDIILQSKGLGVRKTATCCGSRPRTNSPPRSRSTWKRQEEGRARPARAQSFQLNYTKADDITKALSAQSSTAAAFGGALTRFFLLSTARQCDCRSAH